MPDNERGSKHAPADALGAAIAAVRGEPERDEHWELVEELAESAQRPSEVRELFRQVLDQDQLTPELASSVGQRAVRFYEAWYGDDSAPLAQLLSRVLEIDPRAHWAFERLTVVLTASERWDELLDAYDHAIARADQTSRRMRLLDEAAQAAKDFANQPDRAIGYLSALFVLDPDNAPLSASLERLLERQGRFQDLIDHWAGRIDVQPPKQQRDTRLRISACYLEALRDHAAALAQIERVLDEAPEYEPAFSLLEKMLVDGALSDAVRASALGRLKEHFDKRHRPKDVVRVLETSLGFSPAEARPVLLRELITRLCDLHDDERALGHQAALVALEPMPAEREALRALAERTKEHERHAEALVAAAGACAEPRTRVDLLLEAARIHEEALAQPEQAIALYRQVFEAGAGEQITTDAGRKLVRLLEQTEREQETLDVLGRMCELEPVEAVRKTMLGKFAQLAEKLGDVERARKAWASRVGDDGDDVEALSALIDAAARKGDHASLASLLRKRILAKSAAHHRRADLLWLAKLHDEQLHDLDAAIEAQREVCELYGEDPEVVTALTDLLSRAQRWPELAEVLRTAAAREIARFTDLQTQLGDAYRERLGKPEQAAHRYRAALQIDPQNERARAGQSSLLDDERCRGLAVDSLAEAYAQTDEWQNTLALLPVRLSTEPSEATRAKLLLEAAQLYEERAGDPSQALACYRKAFTLLPDDRATERAIRRLAEQLGQWDAVVTAYRETIALFDQPMPRVAELRYEEGATLEARLKDAPGALAAYVEAARIARERVEFAVAALRVALGLQRYEIAAELVVTSTEAHGALVPELLETVERAIAAESGWEAFARELTAATQARAPELKKHVVRELYERVAAIHARERRDEQAAREALSHAAAADPTHAPTLRALVELQRAAKGPSLVSSLLALSELEPRDLDALREAAEVLLEQVRDDTRSQAVLLGLYDRALALWKRGQAPSGACTAQSALGWALDHLVTLRVDAGQASRALELLSSAVTLPFDATVVQGLRHRAAQLAKHTLEDRARATSLYREILEHDASDTAALAALAELYEQGDRVAELLGLRRHELALDPSPERKLQLRLELARLLGELEARGDRVSSLETNLREQPGHAASLSALCRILREQRRSTELAQLLEAQARALAELARTREAAELWRELAELRERDLHDLPAALAAYREVHALLPLGDASEALARLHASMGEHAAAAEWLELRLGTAPPDTRAVTAVDLAHAHIEAGQRARARGCLEQALAADPRVHEARELLAQLYREAGLHQALAQLLAHGTELDAPAAQQLAWLREAAELYHQTLGAKERAVPVLTRAIELAPDDGRLKAMLAESLRASGRHAEARAVLLALLAGFGRRRSPERAELHYQLARVAESAGDLDEALGELDHATKMDLAHQGALHMLARLARDRGDLERAERAFRGLLLIVRRGKSEEEDALGPAEVFFELYKIALARGQGEQSSELLASALEGASQSEVEARRLTRVLRARGEQELLLRVLDARLSLARKPELQAELLAAKAEVLEHGGQGAPTEARELLLRALELDPSSALVHARAWQLCEAQGELTRYIDALSALADEAQRSRTAEGIRLGASLTLRLGQVIEEALRDLDRAAGLYAKVEASGHYVTDAWLAMARVAGARGDTAEQRRVLARITEQEDEGARTHACFLLAELELGQASLRDAGLATLARALDYSSDYARAKSVLGPVIEAAPEHPGVLRLYERVARSSRDDGMLLDLLERRAARKGAGLDDVREGIELALRIGEMGRAESLLTRAAELARKLDGERGAATWVFSGLAECRLQAGDTRGAMAHLREALDFAREPEAQALCRELAELASAPGGDLCVAAEMYERLLEAAPADRENFEPMLRVLAQLGDHRRFEAFAERTLAVLLPLEDRAFLYLAHAQFLTQQREDQDAAAVLRQLLEEDPANLEATNHLLAIYQRHGMNAELAELLRAQFDRARDDRNLPAITELGLRLGELYGSKNADDACDVYRAALEWDPAHRGLLVALLARMPAGADARERAELETRLLATESGQPAAELALGLADAWAELGEDARVQEVLELGYRACPEHDALRGRLESHYTAYEAWRSLAELMIAEATRLGPNLLAVTRFKNAAVLYRDKLVDMDGSARALRSALAIVPDDLSLLGELSRNLAAAGQHDTAIADVTRLLDSHPQADGVRVDLLRVRADLHASVGQLGEAVMDLEEAYIVSPDELALALATALDAQRAGAREAGDAENESLATMRLVSVLSERGEEERAREVLSEWVDRHPGDALALRELLRVDLAAERLDAVAGTCERLVEVEEGDARLDAALLAADAYQRLGRPADALLVLSRVHADAPDHPRVRDGLRALYAELGHKRELARLLLGDAELAASSDARAKCYLDAAQLLLDEDDPQAAIEPLARAMELAPDDERTRLVLVDVYLRLDRVDEALGIVDQAMHAHKRRRSPELALLQVRMGRICGLRGDRDAQLKWLNTALDTDRKSGEIASELAEAAMSMQDYDTAMKALRTLTMMEDPRPITRALAFLRQAQIAVIRGDTQRALHWARKAKSLDESSREADELLAQLGG